MTSKTKYRWKPGFGPEIVVAFADIHSNDAVGVNAPGFRNDDDNATDLGRWQRALWEAWVESWAHVERLATRVHARVVGVSVGDTVDRNKHTSYQLLTENRASIVDGGAAALAPARRVCDMLFIVRGTPAHEGEGCELSELVGAAVGAECDALGHASWWVLPATFGGVRFEFTHRPPSGGRLPWTQDQAASRSAAILAVRALKSRRHPPQVAVWGHVHFRSRGWGLGVEGFFCPPWKLVGNYGYQSGVGSHAEPVGSWVFTCQDGRYTVEALDFPVPPVLAWEDSDAKNG